MACFRARAPQGAALSPTSLRICRGFHEGPVLPEVGEDPPPRLQGGPPPWQGLRDLQVQPAFQGAPALSRVPGRPDGRLREAKGRGNAAFPFCDARLTRGGRPWVGPTIPLPAGRPT